MESLVRPWNHDSASINCDLSSHLTVGAVQITSSLKQYFYTRYLSQKSLSITVNITIRRTKPAISNIQGRYIRERGRRRTTFSAPSEFLSQLSGRQVCLGARVCREKTDCGHGFDPQLHRQRFQQSQNGAKTKCCNKKKTANGNGNLKKQNNPPPNIAKDFDTHDVFCAYSLYYFNEFNLSSVFVCEKIFCFKYKLRSVFPSYLPQVS